MGDGSIIAEHGADVVSILIWAISGLFAALVILGGIIASLVKAGFAGVKSEIRGIKTEVAEDRKAMIQLLHQHENRITRIETSCEIHHGRRIDDQ